MTKKSRSSLITQANTDLPDNNSMQISPVDVRGMFKDIIDSFVSNSGETSISGVLRYLSTVSIADDYDLITKKFFDDNTGILLGDYFKQGGNSFGATATIGTNDLNDLDFETNGTVRGGIEGAGQWRFGTSTPFVNAYISILSQGNTGATESFRVRNSDMDDMFWISDNGSFSVKSTMNNSTPVFTAYDNVGVELFELLANANIKAPGNFIDVSDLATVFPFGRQNYLSDGLTVAQNWGTGVFKKTDGQDVANMLFQYLATGGTIDLSWSGHYMNGNWALSDGAGNYGGGTGVFYFKDASVDATTNPTGGTIIQSKSGALFSKHTDGSYCLIAGKQATDSDDYTLVVGESTFIYTGTGGHTLTLHTAVGYKNTELTVINAGSGSLTVNGGSLPASTTMKLVSDNTNWL